MHLSVLLQIRIADILGRHTDVASATEEIASAMADEIEARAQDRVADLRTQIEAERES